MATDHTGPRLDVSFFKGRRNAFLDRLGPGSAAVFEGAPPPTTNQGRFRQQADFYYLTGFSEPGAVAVLLNTSGERRYILIPQPKDPARERWDGNRAGVQGAISDYGADQAFPIDELEAELPKLLEKADTVYLTPDFESRVGRRIFESFQDAAKSSGRIGRGACELRDPKWILAQMRVRKRPEELELIREAAAITARSYEKAVPQIAPGRWEYEIEAQLDHGFRAEGGEGPAYTTIVGSAGNSTVLHYIANERRMCDGDLVLIDAATSYQRYASDVTRTYPVGGRFTKRQRAVYECVLRAQKAALAEVRAGASVTTIHRAGTLVLIEGIVQLGWLPDRPPEELFDESAHRPYFMHGIGHHLGLDVHDSGPSQIDGEPYRFEEGVVFTVEPGIYVPMDAEGAAAEYAGIGVRIEDSVIVHEGGCEILTAALPKELSEIEHDRKPSSIS